MEFYNVTRSKGEKFFQITVKMTAEELENCPQELWLAFGDIDENGQAWLVCMPVDFKL